MRGPVLQAWAAATLLLALCAETEARSRIDANHASAAATLRSIATAQEQFRAAKQKDEDRDGVAEYGALEDLTAGDAPYLAKALCPGGGAGIAVRSGYCFRLHLPEDPDGREKGFVVYAWPRKVGRSGWITFVATERGDVREASAPRFSGLEDPPPPGAAFDGDPFRGGALLPDWGPEGSGPRWSEWHFVFGRIRIAALAAGAFLLLLLPFLAAVEWRRNGRPRSFGLSPGPRSQVATFVSVGVILVASTRFICDPKPEYVTAFLSVGAVFLSLWELAGAPNLGAALSAVLGAACLEFDTRLWNPVLEALDRGGWLGTPLVVAALLACGLSMVLAAGGLGASLRRLRLRRKGLLPPP